MEKPKYMLFCTKCYHKIWVTKEPTELVESKHAPIPKRANGVDKETMQMTKRYKCPECGYLFKVVRVTESVEEPKKDQDEPKFNV